MAVPAYELVERRDGRRDVECDHVVRRETRASHKPGEAAAAYGVDARAAGAVGPIWLYPE